MERVAESGAQPAPKAGTREATWGWAGWGLGFRRRACRANSVLQKTALGTRRAAAARRAVEPPSPSLPGGGCPPPQCAARAGGLTLVSNTPPCAQPSPPGQPRRGPAAPGRRRRPDAPPARRPSVLARNPLPLSPPLLSSPCFSSSFRKRTLPTQRPSPRRPTPHTHRRSPTTEAVGGDLALPPATHPFWRSTDAPAQALKAVAEVTAERNDARARLREALDAKRVAELQARVAGRKISARKIITGRRFFFLFLFSSSLRLSGCVSVCVRR